MSFDPFSTDPEALAPIKAIAAKAKAHPLGQKAFAIGTLARAIVLFLGAASIAYSTVRAGNVVMASLVNIILIPILIFLAPWLGVARRPWGLREFHREQVGILKSIWMPIVGVALAAVSTWIAGNSSTGIALGSLIVAGYIFAIEALLLNRRVLAGADDASLEAREFVVSQFGLMGIPTTSWEGTGVVGSMTTTIIISPIPAVLAEKFSRARHLVDELLERVGWSVFSYSAGEMVLGLYTPSTSQPLSSTVDDYDSFFADGDS
ncbi:hypothetical protein ACVXZ4_04105 [Lacisediminihabitans sp. FW035]